ncbi:uncharacterized protein BX663DRAFT_511546 [Cokeromyces recurvatus]|uniref:uncharacterized protein n=1 Tax=Cokeromyces recurvatus TaxID=90255 RepID=UPI00221E7266|nr:uncharacterized protein BX663DRAFT_511546 [Cokeromyces recurvatus]KAI7902044.1 hypothetical protein BX663DRAFT_511546 [Cokeromyces recurvatus]
MIPHVPRPFIDTITLDLITTYEFNTHQLYSLRISMISTQFDFTSHSFTISLPTNKSYPSLPLTNIDNNSFLRSSLSAAELLSYLRYKQRIFESIVISNTDSSVSEGEVKRKRTLSYFGGSGVKKWDPKSMAIECFEFMLVYIFNL